jgi:hypothetical protein
MLGATRRLLWLVGRVGQVEPDLLQTGHTRPGRHADVSGQQLHFPAGERLERHPPRDDLIVRAGQTHVAGRVGPQVDVYRTAREGGVLRCVAPRADDPGGKQPIQHLDRLPGVCGGGTLAAVFLPVQFVQHRQRQDQMDVMGGQRASVRAHVPFVQSVRVVAVDVGVGDDEVARPFRVIEQARPPCERFVGFLQMVDVLGDSREIISRIGAVFCELTSMWRTGRYSLRLFSHTGSGICMDNTVMYRGVVTSRSRSPLLI